MAGGAFALPLAGVAASAVALLAWVFAAIVLLNTAEALK